jgi:RNA polymerase sigma factor (sigma-70 family)
MLVEAAFSMSGSTAVLDREETLEPRASDGTEAFGAIYDRYFPRVYGYVRYCVRDPVAADDITARVFERALSKRESYDDGRGEVGAWLFGIARNAVRDHRRARLRWRFLPIDILHGRSSSSPAADQVLIADENRRRLHQALERLDDRERDLLGLKFAAGLGNRAIAELTGLTSSHVGVLLYRAIRKLRSRLCEEK